MAGAATLLATAIGTAAALAFHRHRFRRQAALDGLLERVAADLDARALVLSGAGGHFCAGADFGRFLELMQATPGQADDPIAHYNRRFGALLERVAALPVTTIAVVSGSAMGGGCGLAASTMAPPALVLAGRCRAARG